MRIEEGIKGFVSCTVATPALHTQPVLAASSLHCRQVTAWADVYVSLGLACICENGDMKCYGHV